MHIMTDREMMMIVCRYSIVHTHAKGVGRARGGLYLLLYSIALRLVGIISPCLGEMPGVPSFSLHAPASAKAYARPRDSTSGSGGYSLLYSFCTSQCTFSFFPSEQLHADVTSRGPSFIQQGAQVQLAACLSS